MTLAKHSVACYHCSLISAFVTKIVQSFSFLNPQFQDSSHRLWVYYQVCVGPHRSSHDSAQYKVLPSSSVESTKGPKIENKKNTYYNNITMIRKDRVHYLCGLALKIQANGAKKFCLFGLGLYVSVNNF